MKIILAGGIIDFYINRKKYNNYKTRRGQMNYIYSMLTSYLSEMEGKVVNDIKIRDASITSNNFWGVNEFCFPPDLNYSCNNEMPKLPEDSIDLPVRIFMVDLVGVMEDELRSEDVFFDINNKKYHFEVSNFRVV